MFLVRETGWSVETVLGMDIEELHWWVVESVKLHNRLHKTD